MFGRTAQRSPAAAFALGLVAGALGNGVMTGYQLLVRRAHGTGSSGRVRAWKNAPAPAQVAGKAWKRLTGTYPNVKHVPMLTQAMHWGYGVTWGGIYGLAQSHLRARPAVRGTLFGAALWGASYAQLVPLGIYEPPWEYPVKDLGVDLSYHLVYGVATAYAFDALAG
jgi:hypothetical protein